MKNIDIKDKILYLQKGLIFLYNINDKKFYNIHKGNTFLNNENTFDEFCDTFIKTFDLVDSFRFKLWKFFNNLVAPNEPFDLLLSYTQNNGMPIVLTYKGYKVDDENILFSITAEKSEDNDIYDDLTKCNKKNYIVSEVAKSISENKEFVLMIINIDNFKTFNETFGQMFGDMILIETAASIKRAIGDRGSIARIGGDEFLALIHVKDNYDVIHETCRQVRAEVDKLNGSNIKNATLSATIGCSSYPSDGDNFELLYKKADSALVRGKRKGKNCFIIYSEERCGKVTLDSAITSGKAIDKNISTINNYNVISGIIELLNRPSALKTNFIDSLSLIGNYFLLDRITLSVINPDNGKISDYLSWINPLSDRKVSKIIPRDENVSNWRLVYDKINMIKINQVSSNTHLPIYKQLESEGTTAMVAFELQFDNKIFGQLRFDMCSINRFWQPQDVSSFMLLSKAFAITISRNYSNLKYYNELYVDKLTGINNYSRWLIDVKDFIDNHKDTKYSIITFGLRDYYSLVSIVGSSEGERIIKKIAEWLKKSNSLLFCRVTGEIFALLTLLTSEKDIRLEFSDLNKYLKTGRRSSNTLKFKAGVYTVLEIEDLHDALDKSSFAMDYEDENDDIVFFTEEIYNEAKEEKLYELHMEKALEDNEFMLYIQPKISTTTGKIEAAEALTRWNYKFKTILAPYKFIPLFERTGFITQLDYRVFENVCIFLRDLINNGIKPVPISINVSRYTKDYDEYINTINSLRDKYNIPSNLLELEITEGMYTENVNDIKEFVDKLKKCGYSISIDDFGSGYSNLNNIVNLNFDILKLDKSICSMTNNRGEFVLKAIIDTAKFSGHTVVCEGVETKETYEKLKAMGADLIQGYYFDKPLEQSEFKAKYMK